MYKITSFLIGFLLLTGCQTSSSFSQTPKLGMRFQQAYPVFAGGGLHAGLDIDVPVNTPVKSIADGTVMFASQIDIRGIITNIVVVNHGNSIFSRYLHIDKLTVKQGDKVKQGDQLAVTAMNGPGGPFTNSLVPYPHLHLEIYKNGEKINPEDLKMTCRESVYIWPVGC